jgi:hypothetical protein
MMTGPPPFAAKPPSSRGREQTQGNAGLFKTLMTAGSWQVKHNTLIYMGACSNVY